MASLTTFKEGPRAGAHRIVMTLPGRRRPAIYLGRMELEAAEHIRDRITAIEACRKAGDDLSKSLAAWVDSLADEFHEKLSRVGLVATRKATPKRTVGELVAAFLERSNVKPGTRTTYEQATGSLVSFLGASTPLEDVTTERADAWQAHIATDTEGGATRWGTNDNTLSVATRNKRIKVAKAVFRRAVRWQWIQRSPFDHMKAGSQANAARAFYVTPEATAKILDKCPSLEWKLVVGLCRYAGVRCPSEIVGMTWDDVLWDSGRLVVRPTKTAGHAGHEVRVVPICPELREILDQAFDVVAPGETKVVPMLRSASRNLRTRFSKIVTRAGLETWPRLFQNLRSSRATEWVEAHPSHVVARWLGHTVAVAAAHYLQPLDHHADAVVSGSAGYATRHATRADPVEGSRGVVVPSQAKSLDWLEDHVESVLTSRGVATARTCTSVQLTPRGFEPRLPP